MFEDRSEGRADNPIEVDDSSGSEDIDIVNESRPDRQALKRKNTADDDDNDSEGESGDGGESDGNDDEEEDTDAGEDAGEEDESVEDDQEERTEADGDEGIDVDDAKSADETSTETESENDENEVENFDDDDKDDGNDSNGSERKSNNDDNDNDNEDPDSKEADNTSTKVAKRSQNLWGNIESMSEITRSPYEGNECAEVGEDCFEEFRMLMDCSQTDDGTNPRMVELVGDKLARDLFNARQEIGKSGMLYSANWKEGKIRESDFGWIPKRQLLLCLHEHRFAKGDVLVLQAVTKNLDCTKLVLEAMKLWDLLGCYPNLASNKNEESFVFGPQKVFCYKCQIFVARAFATLQILNKTETLQQSLTKKIKKCLGIMNKNVKANQIELARIMRKAQKRKVLEAPCSEQPDVVTSRNPRKRNSRNSGTRTNSSSSIGRRPRDPKPSGPKPSGQKLNDPKSTTVVTKKPTRKRRRKIPKREEREESIFMLFNTMHMQVQRLNQMMSFFQSQLQDHRGILREEIRENLENGANAKK